MLGIVRRFIRRSFSIRVSLVLLALSLAPGAFAQTVPHVTGTFKTSGNQTPTQAGLRQLTTISGTAVYGTVDFIPFDSNGGRPTRILCGNITYIPQPVHGWVKGDGTLVDNFTAAAGVDLVPTIGCTPTGLVYRATVRFAISVDGRVPSTTWTEDKQIPQQASVDWGTLPAAGITAPIYTGYSTVQQAGASLPARATLNMTGAPVTCADDAVNTRTNCAFTSGSGVETQVNGVDTASQALINHQDSATIAVTNPSAGIVQDAIKANSVTSGMLTGQVGLAHGGANADLSGTGGAGQYVKQASVGAALTVGTIPVGDLPIAIPIGNIGGGGLTGTAPVTVSPTGAVACPTCTTNAGPLTANLPMVGVGGQASAVGTRTGNTTQFASWSGAATAARCVDTDANGNLQITAADCGQGSVSTTGTPANNQMTIFSGPASVTGIPKGLTGQVLVENNAGPPVLLSPGVAGTVKNVGTYTVACDTATTQVDRVTTIEFIITSPTVTMPDPTAAGCGSNFPVTLLAEGVTVTVNRTTTATFTIDNGWSFLSLQTSFVLTSGQYATLTSPNNSIWLVRITGASIDLSTSAATGILAAAREPAHTGDMTNPSGSLATLVKQAHWTETAINFASSPYTILAADTVITCDATGGAVVINLPAAAATGRQITFKKTDATANACTPTRAGADLIDGATSYSMTVQYAAESLIDTASGVWGRSHVSQVGGDIAGTGAAATVVQIEGGAIPVSAALLGTNGGKQVVVGTAHNVSVPLACEAASASGTAYTCATVPAFTPVDLDMVLFEADIANTGSATLAVNGATAATMKKQGGGTNLVANDLLANQWVLFVFDGTNWQMQGQTGNASGGGGAAFYASYNGNCGSGSFSGSNGPFSFIGATCAFTGAYNGAGNGEIVAKTGTLKNFYVNLGTAVPTGLTYTFTAAWCTGANCAPAVTTITCAITAGNVQCNDSAHTQAVTIGDQIDFKVDQTGAGTPASSNISASIQIQ